MRIVPTPWSSGVGTCYLSPVAWYCFVVPVVPECGPGRRRFQMERVWVLEASSDELPVRCDHCRELIVAAPFLAESEAGYSLHGFAELEAFEESLATREGEAQDLPDLRWAADEDDLMSRRGGF